MKKINFKAQLSLNLAYVVGIMSQVRFLDVMGNNIFDDITGDDICCFVKKDYQWIKVPLRLDMTVEDIETAVKGAESRR